MSWGSMNLASLLRTTKELNYFETIINLHCIQYKNSDLTSYRMQCASIRNTSLLMLYRKTVGMNGENHMKHKNAMCGKNAKFLVLNLTVNVLTQRFKGLRNVEM
jgi:hypothetical protein